MTEPTEPVGSAAEEAAKLFGAVADWAREHGRDLGGDLGHAVSGLASQASEGLAPGNLSSKAHDLDAHLARGEDCRYCPVCRAISLFRTASPEVRDHLTSALASLSQAAAAAMATTVPDARRSGVEHIDLTDEWPDAEAGPGPDAAAGDRQE